MKDITQIRIGEHKIGIIGLKQAMEDVKEQHSQSTDEQIADLLLEKLSVKNYISSGAKEEYRNSFLREYKKLLGEFTPDDAIEGLQIRVLGAGCQRCERLERDVLAVLSECGITADLEHVRDLNEISNYGVMGTPALVINGEVKAVGIVPSRSKLKKWIEEGSG